MTLPPVVEAMLAPGFYPHPARDVRLLQTHASYVILTGALAYKIKKPVDFGFLDYSTLAKRRHFIHEELRLNRRFAPELYLGAVAVVETGHGFAFAGHDDPRPPVEWALRMQEFPQDGQLDRRLERGDVPAEALDALAARLAAAHAEAPRHAVEGQARVRKVVGGNYEAAGPFLGDLFDRAAFARVCAATDGFFAERGGLFDDRAAAGWFRECHGDLHARNIATLAGALVPFDAIEFSETYRIIDVLADAAFLAMDLSAFDRDDLANRFLNAYLERMGAWDGAEALALYLSYRAFVRAKINALTAADANVPPGERERARAWARRYFALAARYADRLATGRDRRLTIMHGVSGSGKSTVARALAAETGGLHIRSDAVRKHLAGRPLEGDAAGNRAAGLYGEEMTERTYDRMLALAEIGLKAGFAVVLDARYPLRRQRDAARRLAERAGVPFVIEACEAPRGELVRRLNERTGDISDAGADLVDRQLAEVEPIAGDEC